MNELDTSQAHYTKNNRYPKAYLSPFLVNQIHLRNPKVVAWWSAAFPGCGHMMLCKYFQGFLLMIWEFIINLNAHINTAIMYSMTGKFELAKQVLDTRLFLLYIGIYIYSMWDSYRIAINLNKIYLLADFEEFRIVPTVISALEINYLDNRNTWNAVVWSLVTPGLGHVYINRLPTGYFIVIWFALTVYFSHLLQAVHLTFYGDFINATKVLAPEWLLFLPSLYGFACHDSYVHAIETNKIFKAEQSNFLKEKFQNSRFKMPIQIHEKRV